MKLYKTIKTAMILGLVLAKLSPEVQAEKFPPSADAWQYRTANFLKYYDRSDLQIDSQGRLAIGANGRPLGAVRGANGLPLPIPSLNGSTGTAFSPSTDAGIPVELEVYLDAFSNEFQLQVSYAQDAAGRLPTSLSFLVNDGARPSASDLNKWAIFFVDATTTQLDGEGFQLPGLANRPKLTVCSYQPGVANPLQQSCSGATPILSSQRSSDEHYVSGNWETGLEIFRRIEVSDFNHGLLQVNVRQFTINIDATPILSAFGNVPGLGVGPQGSTANLDDTTIFPPLGLYLTAYAGASFSYSGEIISAVNAGSLQSYLELVETAVNSRCPIDCLGDIWGTGNNGSACQPVAPPAPEGGPAICQKKEFADNLFGLDAGAAGIFELVKYSSRRLKRMSRGLDESDRAPFVRAAKKNQKDAEAAFIDAWTLSWGFPQVMITCDDGLLPADCQVTDLTGQSNKYLLSSMAVRDASYDNVRQLKRLARKSSSQRTKKQVRKMARQLTAQTAERYEESVGFSKEIPSVSVVCSSSQL